jgi:hypothetical protein
MSVEEAELDYPLAADHPPRGRRWVAGLAAGAVLIAGVGVTVAVQSDGNGGAATPEDAVTLMLDAAADEDLLGMADALAPFERDALLDYFTQAGELGRESAESADLSAWIDLAYSDPTFAVTELRSDIASVEITSGSGSFTAGEQLAEAMDGLLRSSDGSSLTAPLDFDLDELPAVVTVQRNGQWYVSVQHTIAEALRDNSGEPLPERIVPVGASSPEAAVREMVEALGAGDERRMIELLDPIEVPVAHDYGALVISVPAPITTEQAWNDIYALQDALADALRMFEVTELDVTADRETVTIDRLELRSTYEGTYAFALSLDGSCVEVGESDTGVEPITEPGLGCDELPDRELMPEIAGAVSDAFPGISISTVQRDGQWYVKPVSSMLDLLVDWMGAMQDEFGPEALSEALVTWPFWLGTPTESEAVDPECDLLFEPADQEACWRDLLAVGAIATTDMPVELQVPECYPGGLEGGFDVDPDTLATCLQTAIAEGRLAEGAVYPQLLHPECWAFERELGAIWDDERARDLYVLWAQLDEHALACAEGDAEPPVFDPAAVAG